MVKLFIDPQRIEYIFAYLAIPLVKSMQSGWNLKLTFSYIQIKPYPFFFQRNRGTKKSNIIATNDFTGNNLKQISTIVFIAIGMSLKVRGGGKYFRKNFTISNPCKITLRSLLYLLISVFLLVSLYSIHSFFL